MKITDLFDGYPVRGVKLRAPEEIFSEAKDPAAPTPFAPQKKSRGQKAMLIAASLMLALTGIVMGTLALSRTLDGSALAEGVPSVEEPVEALEAETSEFAAASAGEEAAEPLLSAEIGETVGYIQRGNLLTLDVLVYLPKEMAELTELDFSPIVAMDAGDPAREGRELILVSQSVQDANFVGVTESGEEAHFMSAQMTFQVPTVAYNDSMDLALQITGGGLTAETNSVLIGYYCPNAFATNGCAYEFYDPETPDDRATIRRMSIVNDKMEFVFAYPGMDDLDTGGLLFDAIGGWADILVKNYLDQGKFHMYLQDGTRMDYSWDCPYFVGISQYENTGVLTIDISDTPIVPAQIERIELESLTIDPEAADISIAFAAEDVDGDGILTAALDATVTLDGQTGTLTSVTVDPATGEFILHHRVPSLEDKLHALSPTGDFNAAMRDSEFAAKFTEWENAFLLDLDAYFVLTDGTKVPMGSGNVVSYQEGDFTGLSKLSIVFSDHQINVTDAVIAYLELGGVRYDFE